MACVVSYDQTRLTLLSQQQLTTEHLTPNLHSIITETQLVYKYNISLLSTLSILRN